MKTLTFLVAGVALAATPAEFAIDRAQAEIAKHPDYAPSYNALAMACGRRARETSDARYYGQAEEALRRSFQIAPDNYDGLKTEVWLELGRHEFDKALASATRLNREMPDDIAVYGYLVDADVELGNYKEAVVSAQWMLDLRRENGPGLARAGILRELHGDLAGALEMTRMAYNATPFAQTEDRAWLLNQIAHLNFVIGDLSKAADYADAALKLEPTFSNALSSLGQVRIAEKRYDEAVKLMRERYAAAPEAANLYALAEALELAGQTAESSKAFAEFEQKSLAETNLAANSNHELVAFYADHAHEPVKALEVAKREIERRKDVYTLDCYAWALAANGEYEASQAPIQKALQLGVKDPKILSHARFIAEHVERTGNEK